MNWQDYQEAVGIFYHNMDGIGEVYQNTTLPDKITGHPRQIDTLLVVHTHTHELNIIIDAKFRKEKVDVKDVEEVFALGQSVGANKCIIVTTSGFTSPAKIKAEYLDLDIRIWSLEEALNLMVPDMWVMCPQYQKDCIVIEHGNGNLNNGFWHLFMQGRCRECNLGRIWCWECGEKIWLKEGEIKPCNCGHLWKHNQEGFYLKPTYSNSWILLKEVSSLSPEYIEWLMGFPPGWTKI